MLEERQPVTVLDVRKAADRAEWAIPGSLHVDAYEALKAGDPDALADAAIPSGRAGRDRLRRRQGQPDGGGAPARPRLRRALAAGGMKAWSLAWNSAEIPLPGSAATVIQVRRTGKGCLSYLIGNAE